MYDPRTAPGPGRPSSESKPDDGRQKTEPSLMLAGLPTVSGPAGAPISVIEVQLVPETPKHPDVTGTALACPEQKLPPASLWVERSVLSGARSTSIAKGQNPVPTPVQQGSGRPAAMQPLLPSGKQSLLSPVESVLVQNAPALAPPLQTPVPGLAGVPVAEHVGQGCAALPVSHTYQRRGIVKLNVPRLRSIVPDAALLKMLCMHTEPPPFATGWGTPKAHPVWLHCSPGFRPVFGAPTTLQQPLKLNRL